MTGRICGTASYVPSFVMDNNDIAKLVDTSDEWIRERTGVERRHIAEEERRRGSDHRFYDFFKCNTSMYSL